MRIAQCLVKTVAIVLVIWGPGEVRADIAQWINGAGGDFPNGNNWQDGLVPGPDDRAEFSIAGQYDVSFLLGDAATDQAFIRNGEVTFDLSNNATYEVLHGNGSERSLMVAPGTGEIATLILSGGGRLQTNGVTDLARGTGSTALLIVEGWGTTLEASADRVAWFSVASLGDGNLLIRDGGTVIAHKTCVIGDFSAGPGGSLIVKDEGSSLIIDEKMLVGSRTNGVMKVREGGRVTVGTTTKVGNMSSESWASSGTLRILDGGTFTSDRFIVAGQASTLGEVFVDGPDATLETGTGGNWLSIGEGGRGTMDISNAGEVISHGPCIIGDFVGADGAVVVRGEGSTWQLLWEDFVSLSIGKSTTGRLEVRDGGSVFASNGLYIGDMTPDSGTTDGTLSILDQSTVTSTGQVIIGNETDARGLVEIDGPMALFEIDSPDSPVLVGLNGEGTVNVINGGVLSTTTPVMVGTLGQITGDGAILGEVINEGEVLPSLSVDSVLAIDGDFAQSRDGRLSIDIGGRTPGVEFGQLTVTGNAMLDGIVEIRLVNGFMPVVGDEFRILSAAAVSGAFFDLQGADLGNGVGFEAVHAQDHVTLRVVQFDCGDGASLKAKCKVGGRKIRGKLKNATPNAEVTFHLDGGQDQTKTINDNGKAKAKWRNQTAGPHRVNVCTLTSDC